MCADLTHCRRLPSTGNGHRGWYRRFAAAPSLPQPNHNLHVVHRHWHSPAAIRHPPLSYLPLSLPHAQGSKPSTTASPSFDASQRVILRPRPFWAQQPAVLDELPRARTRRHARSPARLLPVGTGEDPKVTEGVRTGPRRYQLDILILIPASLWVCTPAALPGVRPCPHSRLARAWRLLRRTPGERV